MDKLQPLIVHKFWILFGAAVVLPVIGWGMGTSKLKEQIDERWKTLDTAFDSAKVTGNEPNDGWAKNLNLLNKTRTEHLQKSVKYLWDRQQRLMVWPTDIKDLMANVAYRAELPESAPDLYRNSYFLDLQRMRDVVDPFDFATGEGKVVVPYSAFEPLVQRSQWAQLPPTSKEMWNAQEDIWLFTALLESIAHVNEGAEGIADAPVRVIQQVKLMGGDRASLESGGEGRSQYAAEEGYAAEDEAGAGMLGRYGAMLGRGFGEEGGEYGGTAGAGGAASIDFNPVEEFGTPTPTASESEEDGEYGESAAGGAANAVGAAAAEMAGTVGLGMGLMRGGLGGAALKADRYVDDDPNLPFKTRGFYLHVTMDHRDVPELLAELTNAAFPVTIVRVHQADRYSTPGGRGMQPNMAAGTPLGGSFEGAESQFGFVGGEDVQDYQDEGGFGGGRLPFNLNQPLTSSMPFGATAVGGTGANRSGFGLQGPNSAKAQQAYSIAMADPYLADVVVAGLLTIFLPPDWEETSSNDVAANPQTPSGGASAAAVSPATEPAAQAVPSAAEGSAGAPAGTSSGAAGSPVNAVPSAAPSEEAAPPTGLPGSPSPGPNGSVNGADSQATKNVPQKAAPSGQPQPGNAAPSGTEAQPSEPKSQ